MNTEYLHFWDEVNNAICEKCGCECEWEGTCVECLEVEE